MSRCLAPPQKVDSRSRAARAIAGGDRFRALETWSDMAVEGKRLREKLRAAAAALSNVPMKRGMTRWREVWTDEAEAKALLLNAVRGIVNAKARKVFNSWSETCAEANALKDKLRAAAAAMSPDGRAKKSALLKFIWLRRRALAMQRACASFVLAGCKRALLLMGEQIAFRRKLQRGGAAFFMRKTKACWNVWSEMSLKGAANKAKLGAALARMSPEGRAMGMGFAAFANAVNAKDAEGSTPLLVAAKKGHTEAASMLIGTGFDVKEMVNGRDADGNSALHWAARKGHADVAAQLLEAGADVDARNKEQSTPLHWAARKDNAAVIERLLLAAASAGLRNKWGATALDQAQSVGAKHALALLGATRPKRGGSPGGPSDEGGGERPAAWGAPPAAGKRPANAKTTGELRKMGARKKAEAVRREAVVKALAGEQEAQWKDQELRRKRTDAEKALHAALEHAGIIGGSTSPRKNANIGALAAATKEAARAGCSAPMVKRAEAALAAAARRKREAKASVAKAPSSPPPKGQDAMTKLERKLAKKMGGAKVQSLDARGYATMKHVPDGPEALYA